MAQITLSSGSFPRPYRSPWGTIPIRHFLQSTAASTAVIKLGDVVQSDTVTSTGPFRIVRAVTASSNILVNSTDIVGIAAEASTGDGTIAAGSSLAPSRGAWLPVWLADRNVEFIANIHDGAGLPAASSMIGLVRGLLYDSTLGIYCIDSTNSTVALGVVRITDVPFAEQGDTNGRVVFKFMSSRVSPAI